jgi:hypothetical protein
MQARVNPSNLSIKPAVGITNPDKIKCAVVHLYKDGKNQSTAAGP